MCAVADVDVDELQSVLVEQGAIAVTNLAELLLAAGHRPPDAVALHHDGIRAVTYGELAERRRRAFAGQLACQGVEPGDRVAIDGTTPRVRRLVPRRAAGRERSRCR